MKYKSQNPENLIPSKNGMSQVFYATFTASNFTANDSGATP